MPTNESDKPPRVMQAQRPSGFLGRLVLWNMNSRHGKVTDWGLSNVSSRSSDIILDVGCGGGRTVSKLAAIATEGKVYGIDYSRESVAFAKRVNQEGIARGRVQVDECSVSGLPFPDDMFDLATAVETHFWWPDLAAGMREILRVLKPGGTLVVIAEIYKGANTRVAKMAERYLPKTGMKFMTAGEHQAMFSNAGYEGVRVVTEPSKGWICAMGQKPHLAPDLQG
jgi:ubiquinone/menaquinone biosynthesis C-methylase UbiE